MLSAIESANLKVENLKIIGEIGKKISVHDPTREPGKDWREGDYFAILPKELVSILPGSTLLAGDFVKVLGKSGDVEDIVQVLEGDKQYDKDRGVVFEHEEDSFSLKVYNGSTNERALHLSELAVNSFEDEKNRAEYQKIAADVVEPILKDESKCSARIVEDVIASGETIAGVLAVLEKQKKIQGGSTVRVDVISATTQGLLILRKFAYDNGIALDIRVGYLAYGLSKGVEISDSEARAHANYVIYPDGFLERLDDETKARLDRLRGDDTNIYVVGDMGDAFKSLQSTFDYSNPYNKYRCDDKHGVRGEEEGCKEIEKSYDKNERKGRTVIYYLANGGYFMRSLMRLWGLSANYPKSMMSAKRIWTDKSVKVNGSSLDDTVDLYGVLVKEKD